jgi:hypothetical protein
MRLLRLMVGEPYKHLHVITYTVNVFFEAILDAIAHYNERGSLG